MGSQSSKVVSKAAGAASRRQYPSTSSITNNPSPPNPIPPPPASVRPSPRSEPPSSTKSAHIDLDARDPHFGSALRQAGIARRVPQHSNSPDESFPISSLPPAGQQVPGQHIFPTGPRSSNPALVVVRVRESIAKRWEQESESIGRASFQGRTLLSAREIKEALRLRDENGRSAGDIEKQLKLESGIMAKLGPPGAVANA